MKNTILLDFFELSFKEMDSYISALQKVNKIPLLTNYLTNYVIPIVANWPKQKKFTYADKNNLALLTKKAQMFFLEIFDNVYQKLSQSSIIEGQRKKITYKLASLNLVINKKQMPLGFSNKLKPNLEEIDKIDEDSLQDQRIENDNNILK
ncbi:19165_t:CDS:2, partial [Cetraspora pellucida]